MTVEITVWVLRGRRTKRQARDPQCTTFYGTRKSASPPLSGGLPTTSSLASCVSTNAYRLCMPALQRQTTKLSPSVLYRFISVAARLKDDILVVQPSHHLPEDPALVLPPAIVTLISRVCDIPQDEVEYHWDRLKDVIWCSTDLPMQESALEALFLKHGHDIGFCEFLGLHCSRNVNLNCSFEASSRTIYPP
jgi:hypothetical protein